MSPQIKTATLSYSTVAGNKLTASDVVKAKAKFGEKLTEPAVLVVNSTHYADLVLDDKWVPTEKGVQMLMDGVVGSLHLFLEYIYEVSLPASLCFQYKHCRLHGLQALP